VTSWLAWPPAELSAASAAVLRALAGGVAVGSASALLLAGIGRVAGVSGILGGMLRIDARDRSWRASFAAGLALGAWLVALVSATPVSISASPLQLALAGALVGFGTQLGSGCTSGHGVCGLARRSRRSLVATAVFMGVAAATVFASRHLLPGR
jgi:hypothetical protein